MKAQNDRCIYFSSRICSTGNGVLFFVCYTVNTVLVGSFSSIRCSVPTSSFLVPCLQRITANATHDLTEPTGKFLFKTLLWAWKQSQYVDLVVSFP